MPDNEALKHIIELKGLVGKLDGKIEVGFQSMNSHISAVSNKADDIREDLNRHKESNEAHGGVAADKKESSILTFISLVLSAIAVAWGVFHPGMHK